MHEGVGKRAVVRHEEQTFGVIIQPPNGIHALRHVRDELRDGAPALFIVHGGHKAARLAEHQVDRLRLLPRLDARAVELDHVLLCVGLLAKARGVAVDDGIDDVGRFAFELYAVGHHLRRLGIVAVLDSDG